MGGEKDEVRAAWGDEEISLEELGTSGLDRSLAARRRLELQGEGPDVDPRRLRAQGRTMQLNVKIRPEVRAKLDELVKQTDSTMAAIVEWCIQEYYDAIVREAATRKDARARAKARKEGA
jgi:predicted transcriptional regulator